MEAAQPILFWLVAAATALCAVATVVTQNIVRSATWLLFTLSGTAGVFFLLAADLVGDFFVVPTCDYLARRLALAEAGHDGLLDQLRKLGVEEFVDGGALDRDLDVLFARANVGDIDDLLQFFGDRFATVFRGRSLRGGDFVVHRERNPE